MTTRERVQEIEAAYNVWETACSKLGATHVTTLDALRNWRLVSEREDAPTPEPAQDPRELRETAANHSAAAERAHNRRQDGFTLIELCIAVVVVGILAAIAIPNYIALQDNARCALVKANMHKAQIGVEDFAVWNDGSYPETVDAAMAGTDPLVNPFGADLLALTDGSAATTTGVVAYGYGAASIIGGSPTGLLGWRPAPNGYRIRGYGKTAPLALELPGGEQ